MRANYTLPRLYLGADLGGDITLSREHAHYLGTVLRKGEGDRVRLFDGRTGEWSAVVTSASRKSMTVHIDECLRPFTPVPDIRLLFAPLRKHRTATLIEKATELGVRTLQPVITARTQFPKLNLDRSRAQIVEAAEQTERLDLPELCAPLALENLLTEGGNPAGAEGQRPLLFADEAGDAGEALSVINTLSLPIDILIGPEGGFTPEERAMIRARPDVHPIDLGPRILRADTAGIAVLSLVQSSLGDWT